MAEQKRKAKPTQKTQENEEVDVAQAKDGESKAAIKDELDDLLDEIDDVLETNAEEFVKNYVQKGGQ